MQLAISPFVPHACRQIVTEPAPSKMKIITNALLVFSLLSSVASAGTVKIPEDKPAVTADIPDAWKPEKIDNGIVIESPDQIATMYFEVTPAKAADDLLKENLEYLKKEHKV